MADDIAKIFGCSRKRLLFLRGRFAFGAMPITESRDRRVCPILCQIGHRARDQIA